MVVHNISLQRCIFDAYNIVVYNEFNVSKKLYFTYSRHSGRNNKVKPSP